MAALLLHPAVLDSNDDICRPDGGQPVSHNEGGATCPSLVPQPTCWKWVGGTKGSKRAFFSLTAVFSAKNGRKLKNGLFLESAVREFSENGFGSEKN